jgi:hypothetical protein
MLPTPNPAPSCNPCEPSIIASTLCYPPRCLRAAPRWFVDVTVSKDGQLVTINSNDRVSSEVRLVRCGAPMDPPTLVHPRQEGVQYFVEHNNVR